MNEIIPIHHKIYTLRGKQIMLDSDLAELYQVETKVLNQAVKRNIERFPEDFMFQLSEDEFKNLKSQFVTSCLEVINKMFEYIVGWVVPTNEKIRKPSYLMPKGLYKQIC